MTDTSKDVLNKQLSAILEVFTHTLENNGSELKISDDRAMALMIRLRGIFRDSNAAEEFKRLEAFVMETFRPSLSELLIVESLEPVDQIFFNFHKQALTNAKSRSMALFKSLLILNGQDAKASKSIKESMDLNERIFKNAMTMLNSAKAQLEKLRNPSI